MILIISVVIVSVIALGLIFVSYALLLATRILKISDTTFRKAFRVSVLYFIFNVILTLLLFLIFNGLFALRSLFIIIGSFVIAHALYKKYYGTTLGKNIALYIIQGVLSAIAAVILAIVFILPVRSYLVQPFVASGRAMEPALHSGDYVLVNEYDKNYKRGDIVTYRYPRDTSQIFIGRIVGLPNERVGVNNGSVWINGNALDETSYLSNTSTLSNTDVVLTNDQYFILGDNRNMSNDSRVFGPVNKQAVIGKYWKTINFLSNKF